MNAADVLVVGGGAMGSAAAWWLSRQGRSVLLLERYQGGHAHGSSHGTSRVFRLAYPDPLYVHMAQQTLPLWRELEDEAGTALLTTTGGVDHGSAFHLATVHDTLLGRRVRCEVLPVADATDRWPQMRFDGPVLFHPDAGRLDADQVITTLHDQARKHGAQLHFNEPVVKLHVTDSGVTAATSHGTYRAEVAIITAGAWTPTLLAELVTLPALRVVQAEVFHFTPQPHSLPWPTFNHEQPNLNMYGVPTASDGVKVAQHRTAGPVTTAESRTCTVESGIQRQVRNYVRDWLPGLEPRLISETTCLYTMTDDEDFLIDRIGPLVVASPCSGHGFKFTPLIGRILADIATGAGAPHPRFALH